MKIRIDALDEAGEAGRNPLGIIPARNAQQPPYWLGFAVTRRPESPVQFPLQGPNPFALNTRAEANGGDICGGDRESVKTHLVDVTAFPRQLLDRTTYFLLASEEARERRTSYCYRVASGISGQGVQAPRF